MTTLKLLKIHVEMEENGGPSLSHTPPAAAVRGVTTPDNVQPAPRLMRLHGLSLPSPISLQAWSPALLG